MNLSNSSICCKTNIYKIKRRKRKPYKQKVESNNQMTLFDFTEQACKEKLNVWVLFFK